jgi:hypothetical protein
MSSGTVDWPEDAQLWSFGGGVGAEPSPPPAHPDASPVIRSPNTAVEETLPVIPPAEKITRVDPQVNVGVRTGG